MKAGNCVTNHDKCPLARKVSFLFYCCTVKVTALLLLTWNTRCFLQQPHHYKHDEKKSVVPENKNSLY